MSYLLVDLNLPLKRMMTIFCTFNYCANLVEIYMVFHSNVNRKINSRSIFYYIMIVFTIILTPFNQIINHEFQTMIILPYYSPIS